ncbi:MAG TPA: hypothetical protein VK589_02045 [Chryseolinea sp.]|nr:hypothetical protein [Chryseolinea sp.]
MKTEDGRLKLTFSQTIDHYFIVVFLLIVPGLTVHNIYKIYVTHTYEGVRSAGELLATSVPFFILAIAFIFIQKNGLKFQVIKTRYTDEEFQEAVKRTIADLKWQVEHNEKDFFRAYRRWDWAASWGEMITIVKEKDQLFINSICDPNKPSSVTSWGWNKKNIEVFRNNLTHVVNGQREHPTQA